MQSAGFMGAFRDSETLPPMLAGTLGSRPGSRSSPAFCGSSPAPFVEALRGNRALGGALAAITAAVVGVILNLAIWFALHVVFAEVNEVKALGMTLDVPVPSSLRAASLLLTAGALLAVFRFKAGMIPTLGACAGLGLVYHLLGGPT
jgi:chromate transporter